MINKKEIISILLVILILSFLLNLLESWKTFLTILLSVFIIIGSNIFIKKILAHYFDSEIEIKLWEVKRFGFKKGQHFKKPFPAGAFFPIISKILFFPFKNFIWMASLVFDVKPKTHKAAKRHGLYSFSEVTESQIGFIAAAGITINLILAIIGYFLGFVSLMQGIDYLQLVLGVYSRVNLDALDDLNEFAFRHPVKISAC